MEDIARRCNGTVHAESIGLPIGRYRLRFRSAEPQAGQYPPSLSAWRGGFGHALRRTVCVTRAPHCTRCLLLGSCSYPYLFETPPPAQTGKMRCYRAVPHPYLFTGCSEETEALILGLTLIGRGNRYLAYALHALEQAARRGVGSARHRFALDSVEQEVLPGSASWRTIYRPGGSCTAQPPRIPKLPPVPAAVTIRLLSPLRLKRDGELVGPEAFCFADLFGSLLRRISMLSYFHSDTPLETDFAGLMSRARQVTLSERALAWQDWTRFSSRQRTHMAMGGLVGVVHVRNTDLAPFWPFLWLGQWVHAGKAAVMGNGCYRLEPLQACID